MLCSDVLRENRGLLPWYGPHEFSNHASMALIALERLGGAKQQLADFFVRYCQQKTLQTVSDDCALNVTDEDWLSYLGQRQMLMPFYRYFQDKINSTCVDDALRAVLSHLRFGLASHAFHGVIRLAYAIEVQDTDEIAFALAYWASVYLPLVPVSDALFSDDLSIVKLLSSMQKDCAALSFAGLSNIEARIKHVVASSEFGRSFRQLPMLFEEQAALLAQQLMHLYNMTHNFIVLHAVTGGHALRILLQYVDDASVWMQQYWYAVSAAVVAADVGRIEDGDVSANPFSDYLQQQPMTQVLQSMDDHRIKLTYSCVQQSTWLHDVMSKV